MTQRKQLYTKPRARRRRMCALVREEHSEEDGHRKEEGRKEEKRCSPIADDTQLPGEMLSDVSASVRRSGRARKAAEPPPGFVYTLDLAREFASDSDRE